MDDKQAIDELLPRVKLHQAEAALHNSGGRAVVHEECTRSANLPPLGKLGASLRCTMRLLSRCADVQSVSNIDEAVWLSWVPVVVLVGQQFQVGSEVEVEDHSEGVHGSDRWI